MKIDGLDFLYHTCFGRAILKILVNPGISRLAGRFLDSSLSKGLIRPFIRKNNIDMTEYKKVSFHSFNEFFCREIKEDRRPFLGEENDFLSPCDGLLTPIRIRKNTIYPVKQSHYTLKSLLKDAKLAKEYENGWCLVFRLCVNHYHRYAYQDQGRILKHRKISGILHTVRPIALEEYPVFQQNSREYMILKSRHFDKVIQMEVGAMLVGKIDNYHKPGYSFERGEEKGRFLYGGSTIIMIVKDGLLELEDKLSPAISDGIEIPVKMGEKLGKRI